jgi:Ca2+-binding EF-hand superfamily protein
MVDNIFYFSQEIINEADMDRNGLIDYTEFFQMMSPQS